MILDTQFLKQWAGVDVVEGRIQRRLGGKDYWEDEPALKALYQRLRDHVHSKTVEELLYLK